MSVKIQKKDSRLEDFDRNKVLGGAIKSGASGEEAENVAKQIEVWVETAAVNGVVNSTELRSKILEILRLVNPNAAVSFENYRKQA
ncbi:MAG: hypothetical protein Q8N98_01285 [bacterium]|nr:hypothetical protein [bacterium]